MRNFGIDIRVRQIDSEKKLIQPTYSKKLILTGALAKNHFTILVRFTNKKIRMRYAIRIYAQCDPKSNRWDGFFRGQQYVRALHWEARLF